MKSVFPKTILVAILVVVDQFTKHWFKSGTYSTLNTGGAWGMFPSLAWPLLTALVLLIVCRQWWKETRSLPLVGWSFILAGGVSNLLDRLLFEGVRDFIYYPYLNVTGNVADIYLAVGLVLLLISSLKRK